MIHDLKPNPEYTDGLTDGDSAKSIAMRGNATRCRDRL